MIRIKSVRDEKSFAQVYRSLSWTPYIEKTAKKIISDVSKKGDLAVLNYEKKFSKYAAKKLLVSKSEITRAYDHVSQDEIRAIKLAKKMLETTEKKTLSALCKVKGRTNMVHRSFEPIFRIGCYIPGGEARYPSTAIMTIVPAKVAGVRHIHVASPPGLDGHIDPLTLVAADMCGAEKIYCMGGAQAIAALAYGTKTVTPVDKIVGPGGPFVTVAKWFVSKHVAIDMLAGPTELCILADSSSDPELIAYDLVAQAEHSEYSTCCVVTNSNKLAKRVDQYLEDIVERDSRSHKSIKKRGFIAVCKSQNNAIYLANMLSPEHVQVMTKSPQKDAPKIKTAGIVLVGSQTPSAASDYLLGSNHVLPTDGGGRVRGPLSALDFLRLRTSARASTPDLLSILPHMKALTDAEGFPAHYESVRRRVQ